MPDDSCKWFESWWFHGLQINQCVEYWPNDGCCHEALSPHDGEKCPWHGYPNGPAEIKGPDAALVSAVKRLGKGPEE